MTIIEAALEKTKALRGQPEPLNPPGGRAHDYSRRAVDRANDTIPAPVAPSTQIQPHRVAFDPETARENRLLLSASLPEDHGTIAAYGMLRTRILHRTR